MKKKEKCANINWSREKKAWVLMLWDGEEWAFSKSWGVRSDGEDPISGNPIDWVHDSVLCEIAHLQELGYEVTVTC